MIVARAQVIATLGHGGAGGLRPAVDHDARRLALGVRVDDADRRRKIGTSAAASGRIEAVTD